MLLDSQYTLINQLQFYLVFDNDVKKLIVVNTGDIVNITYRKNSGKAIIQGKVDKIGCNFNSSLGRLGTTAYIKVDGSEEYEGVVEYIKPSDVLDLCIVESNSGNISNPVCSVDNTDQKVLLLRENEIGDLQYSKDGITWKSCSSAPQGKSAYEVAVEFGFRGSERQWLCSLRGKDGVDGKDGKTGKVGPSIAPYVVFENTQQAINNYDLVPYGKIVAVLFDDTKLPGAKEAHMYLKPEEHCMAGTSPFGPPVCGCECCTTGFDISGYQYLGVLFKGNQGDKGDQGDPGKTPVKGEDYFTEQDIKDLIEKVKGNGKNEPYTVQEQRADASPLNMVFCCGIPVTIEDNLSGGAKIKWVKDGTKKELDVDKSYWIFGGADSRTNPVSYQTSSIIMNSGTVHALIGGNYGYGSVGNAAIVANGGVVDYIAGGGKSYGEGKGTYENTVGKASIILNGNANVTNVLYGGTGSGDCANVNEAYIEMNKGHAAFISAGGSNATTIKTSVVINGGTVDKLQGVNRGHVCNVDIEINDGTITKMWAGGETEDEQVTATYDSCVLKLKGGSIGNLYSGKNGGAENADKISGKYESGVIQSDEEGTASKLHLTQYK